MRFPRKTLQCLLLKATDRGPAYSIANSFNFKK